MSERIVVSKTWGAPPNLLGVVTVSSGRLLIADMKAEVSTPVGGPGLFLDVADGDYRVTLADDGSLRIVRVQQ